MIRKIRTVVVPGGFTPYLQAVNIGIFCELKDRLPNKIIIWKNSDDISYTRCVNLKPPTNSVAESWLQDSWNSVGLSNIQNSVKSLVLKMTGKLLNMTFMVPNSKKPGIIFKKMKFNLTTLS